MLLLEKQAKNTLDAKHIAVDFFLGAATSYYSSQILLSSGSLGSSFAKQPILCCCASRAGVGGA